MENQSYGLFFAIFKNYNSWITINFNLIICNENPPTNAGDMSLIPG